jgi:hypothetical protein
LPGDGSVLREGDLVPLGADQARDTVVDAGQTVGRLRGRLVAADLSLAPQIVRHRVEDGPRHQTRAGVVEVHAMRNAGRVGAQPAGIEAG